MGQPRPRPVQPQQQSTNTYIILKALNSLRETVDSKEMPQDVKDMFHAFMEINANLIEALAKTTRNVNLMTLHLIEKPQTLVENYNTAMTNIPKCTNQQQFDQEYAKARRLVINSLVSYAALAGIVNPTFSEMAEVFVYVETYAKFGLGMPRQMSNDSNSTKNKKSQQEEDDDDNDGFGNGVNSKIFGVDLSCLEKPSKLAIKSLGVLWSTVIIDVLGSNGPLHQMFTREESPSPLPPFFSALHDYLPSTWLHDDNSNNIFSLFDRVFSWPAHNPYLRMVWDRFFKFHWDKANSNLGDLAEKWNAEFPCDHQEARFVIAHRSTHSRSQHHLHSCDAR